MVNRSNVVSMASPRRIQLSRPLSPPVSRMEIVVKHSGPSGSAPVRAGWIFTAVLGGAFTTWAASQMHGAAESEGIREWLSLAVVPLTIMAYVYVPAILILSIVAMCRGVALRGLLLLIGSPVLITLLVGGLALMAQRVTEPDRGERRSKVAESIPAAAAVPPTVPLIPDLMPEEISLTNTKGKEIKARVTGIAGDTVFLTVDGKPFEVKMDSLTFGSQARARASVKSRK